MFLLSMRISKAWFPKIINILTHPISSQRKPFFRFLDNLANVPITEHPVYKLARVSYRLKGLTNVQGEVRNDGHLHGSPCPEKGR